MRGSFYFPLVCSVTLMNLGDRVTIAACRHDCHRGKESRRGPISEQHRDSEFVTRCGVCPKMYPEFPRSVATLFAAVSLVLGDHVLNFPSYCSFVSMWTPHEIAFESRSSPTSHERHPFCSLSRKVLAGELIAGSGRRSLLGLGIGSEWWSRVGVQFRSTSVSKPDSNCDATSCVDSEVFLLVYSRLDCRS